MNGTLTLTFESRRGRTYPAHSAAHPPLAYSWNPTGPAALAYLINQAGLMLGGDHFKIRVDLRPRAHAVVAAQSYGKISKGNGGAAREETDVRVAAGAALEWIGEPSMAYAGARVDQRTRLSLAPGSRLIWISAQMLGRVARGERLAFKSWRHVLEVYEDSQLRFLETWRLEPGRSREACRNALEHYAIMGAALLAAPRWTERFLRRWPAWNSPLSSRRSETLLSGSTVLSPRLLLVRFLAADGQAFKNFSHSLWKAARREIIGSPPISLGKY